MTSPLAIWLGFTLAVLAAAVAKPNACRIFVGLFFLVMALGVNLVTVLLDPNLFVEMGRGALVPWYRRLFAEVIAMNPTLFVVPVIIFEVVVGAMILGQRRVRAGLGAGIVFLVAISPLGILMLPNLILAAALAMLIRKEFDRSLPRMLGAKLRTG